MAKDFEPSKAAKKMGVCHTPAECDKMYATLDADKRQSAIELLQRELSEEWKVKIRTVKPLWKRHEWIHHLFDQEIDSLTPEERNVGVAVFYSGHHGFGTGIRNLLRQHGLGEEELGIHNLDDIYVQLLEDAV